MEKITILSRSDDLGSSLSANCAIERVVDAGFIRNVSVMACGPYVEEAAGRLAHRKDICFGMHTTLNAEWDRVKWSPVSGQGPESGLTDENGNFLADPSMFLTSKPTVEAVMREVEAQFEKLIEMGFDIRYVDSHMFSEMFIPGMDEAMEVFIREKGLRDHMYFYHFPPGLTDLSKGPDCLEGVPAGQYLLISHPSLDTPEMRMTGNSGVSGEIVAAQRAAETAYLSDPSFVAAMASAGIQTVRYDEAEFDRRLTVADMIRILGGT